MAKSYIDFLKENGASGDDLKALTEGAHAAAGARAFDALQRQLDQAIADAAAADARQKADRQRLDTWMNGELADNWSKLDNERLAAVADKERAESIVRQMAQRDESLRKVATDMGYKIDDNGAVTPPVKTADSATNGFDGKKYFTREEILTIAEKEGEAIATAQDIAYEHHLLFPDKPLNFRELRKEAVTRRVPVEQVWQEKFKVSDARAARAAADAKAHDDRIREETRKAVESEFAARYSSNPNVTTPVTSRSPFTPREGSDNPRGAGKQPWDKSGEDLSNDRIRNVLQRSVERQTGKGVN